MHPALRILLYILAALALPKLSLVVLLAGAFCLAWLARGRFGAMWHLTWRARWLFLLLAVGYAYGLPGQAAWPTLGDYSPSHAGLQAAGMHVVRLLLLLWLLDALVVGMGAPRLMTGLHGLFSGFAPLGFPAERSTVRLGLTLQAMESNSMRWRDLGTMLAAPLASAAGDEETFAVTHVPWRVSDTLILLGGAGGLLALWLV